MGHGLNCLTEAYVDADTTADALPIDPEAGNRFSVPRLFPELTIEGSWGKIESCSNTDLQKFLCDLASKMALTVRGPIGKDDAKKDVPAGYTYLLQLVFHDLTNSIITPTPHTQGVINLNTPSFDLDTLYGDGPLTQPLFYQGTDTQDNQRYLFRVGNLKGSANQAQDQIPKCPFDLARVTGNAPEMVNENDEKECYLNKPYEPLIADKRNDNHVILSQLLVLFKLLHNKFANAARKDGQPASMAYAKARSLLTRCYRSIVVNDLIKRMIDPDYYERFFSNGEGFEHICKSQEGVASEFIFGIARFGHSMVRSTYQLNKPSAGMPERQIKGILLRSSLSDDSNSPSMLPLSKSWAIDWRLFFEFSHPNMNTARRIDPFSGHLVAEEKFHDAVCPGATKKSLAHMDMERCIRLGLPTGQQIAKKIGAEILSGDKMKAGSIGYYYGNPKIEEQLHKLDRFVKNSKFSKFLEHTPLSYYVLQESALLGEKGAYLGPVGSYILSHTVISSMQNHKNYQDFEIKTMVSFIELLEADQPKLLSLLERSTNQDLPDRTIKTTQKTRKFARLNEAGE